MEPLLSAERKKCEKAEAELEQTKQKLERFHSEWKPAFSRWFNEKFGESVTRARELHARCEELGRLITTVEREAYLSDCSEKTAYARIERMRLEAESAEQRWAETDEEESRADFENDFPPEFERLLKMRFEDMFAGHRLSAAEYAEMYENYKESFREEILGKQWNSGQDEQFNEYEDRSRSRRKHAPQPPEKPRTETSEDIRRKQLYRELARKLHPDLNPNLTPRENELWHEVRNAYEARNMDALETLAAMAENGGGAGYAKISSVSRMQAILQEIQKRLKAAQKTVRQTKKDPAWNFDDQEIEPARLNALSKKIERDLYADIRDLELEVEVYERRIERWKAPTSGGKTRARER